MSSPSTLEPTSLSPPVDPTLEADTLLSKLASSPVPDVPDEAAGDARPCSACEISPDSDPCALPTAVPPAWVTAALCAAGPATLVVWGASVNGVTRLAAAEFAAYPYIATASCAHISPYWASLAAMAGVFWPRTLVATSDAS